MSGFINPLIPRRTFLKSLAVTPAVARTAAAQIASTAPAPLPSRDVDVAVIGAGLSGLTAARSLRKVGVRACVLEARDRVGGRTFDHALPAGNVVEGGGQWVGPGQTEVLELAKELKVGIYDSYVRGKTAVYLSGLRFTTAKDKESADLRRAKALLETMAAEVPLESPWTARHAKEWDATTVGDWLAKNTSTRQASEDFSLDCETELGKPAKISLLFYLFYLRSAGSHQALIVDAQKSRFKGGPQSLSVLMSRELGEDVILGSPVTRIDSSGPRVTIESARVRVAARRVIVAMMPADTRRIEFRPRLPDARQGLVRGWVGMPAIKVNAVYKTAFWRDAGLSGLGISDTGPASVTFDNSPPDGSCGVLLSFLSDDSHRLAPADRRKAVTAGLVRLFGKGAADPVEYVETDWFADPWASGCVSPLPPQILTRFGSALRDPVGSIHWAGTETSQIWCGYMDGAVRAGRRAADEVLTLL